MANWRKITLPVYNPVGTPGSFSIMHPTDDQRRMSREYRDSVVRRRRSKKGSDESAQTQIEVEAIVADIEATSSGARPKSRGSKGSKGSNKGGSKKYQNRPPSDEQLHRGVARERVAKYLQDMEEDDFEFVEGSGETKGRGQGQQEWDWSWVDLGEKGLEEHVIPIVMVSSETEASRPVEDLPVPVRRIPIRVEGDPGKVGLSSR